MSLKRSSVPALEVDKSPGGPSTSRGANEPVLLEDTPAGSHLRVCKRPSTKVRRSKKARRNSLSGLRNNIKKVLIADSGSDGDTEDDDDEAADIRSERMMARELREEEIMFAEGCQVDLRGEAEGEVDGGVDGSMRGVVKGETDGGLGGEVEGEVGGSMRGIVKGETDGGIGGEVKGEVDGRIKGLVKGKTYGGLGGKVKGEVDGSMKGLVKGETNGRIGDEVKGKVDGSMKGLMKGKTNGGLGGKVEGEVDGSMRGMVKGETDGGIGGKVEGEVDGRMKGLVKGETNGGLGGKVEGEVDGSMRGVVEWEIEVGLGGEVEVEVDSSMRGVVKGVMEGGMEMDGSMRGVVEGDIDDGLVSDIEGEVDGSMRGMVKGETDGGIGGKVKGEVDGSMKGLVKGETNGGLGGKVEGEVDGSMRGVVEWEIEGGLGGEAEGEVDISKRGVVKGVMEGGMEMDGSMRGVVEGDIDDGLVSDVEGEVGGSMRGVVEWEMEGGLGGEVEVEVDSSMRGLVKGETNGGLGGAVEREVDGSMRGVVEWEIEGGLGGEVEVEVDSSMRGLVKWETNGGLGGAVEGEVDGSMRGVVEWEIEGGLGGEVEGEVDSSMRGVVKGVMEGGMEMNGSMRGVVERDTDGGLGGDVEGEVDSSLRGVVEGEMEGGMGGPDKDLANFTWTDDFTSFTGRADTYSRSPGPSVESTQDPVEMFLRVWDEAIMAEIVKQTNHYAWQVIAQLAEFENGIPAFLKEWIDTTVAEMYIYFSMLILMSLCYRSRLRDYWTTNLLEMQGFRKIMSRNRFLLITKFLHFIDNDHYDHTLSSYDKKILKVRPIVDHCNSKFSSLYVPTEHLSLDESLLLWKGRLSWVQCIRTKAARFGIKSFDLCEAKTGYLLKCLLYAGKHSTMSEEPIHGFESCPAKVVLELMDGFLDVGHTLVMDNWYNQLPLTRYLKGRRRTDVIGTMNPRCVHVPEDIKRASEMGMVRGKQVARHCGDITIIAWKDVKVVTAISTYHTDQLLTARRAGENMQKPEAVLEYNKYMGGVDRKDQKLAMFLMERKRCRKWYMKVFKRLLNTSLMNTYIIHTRNPIAGAYISHRDFRTKVAFGLLERFDQSRSLVSLLPAPTAITAPIDKDKRRLLSSANHFVEHTEMTPGTNKRKQLRCVRCSAAGLRKSVSLLCSFCQVPLCAGPCWAEYHTLKNLRVSTKKQLLSADKPKSSCVQRKQR